MATRNANILTIIKAKDIPSTEAKSDTAPENAGKTKARKNSSKKTSSKELASTELIDKPIETAIDEILSGRETGKTTQKKSKSDSSKKNLQVPQAAGTAAKDNAAIEVVPQKAKKIVPPHPARTPEEAYRIVIKYNYQRQSQKIFTSLSPEMLAWISVQMETCTGRLADNLAIDKCKLFIDDRIIASLYENLQKPLANPSIIIPTWNVLIDNTLTIIAKLKKLYEIGWTADVIPEIRKGNESHFIKIYLLAQLLEHGVQRTV